MIYCLADFNRKIILQFQNWENDAKKLQEDLRNVQGQRDEDKVRITEFDVSICHDLYDDLTVFSLKYTPE